MRLIEKDELLKLLNADDSLKHARKLIISFVNEAPIIDAAKVICGEWVKTSEYVTTAYGHLDIFKCSRCNAEITIDNYDNYCPNCGAKMIPT